MEHALRCFHSFNDVFLLWQAGKQSKAKANALRMELVKKRKVDNETNAETWTLSLKQREVTTWQKYIIQQNDVSKELDAVFDFRKIQMMSHWVEQIHRYGSFRQYSPEGHEQRHKTNLMDDRTASDHILNNPPQVLTIQCCILCFAIRVLNLEALAQRWENSAATCNVLPSQR